MKTKTLGLRIAGLMKKVATLSSLFIVLIVICLFASCQPKRNSIVIGYIQISPDPVLDTAKASLFRVLRDSGFVDGKNITILDRNAQGDLSMIPTILQSFISQQVDLIVTNSTPCMVSAAQMVKNIPVVFTVATGPEQLEFKRIPLNLYGVYDPYKTKEIADIFQLALPGLKKMGLPFNNSEPNAVYSARVLTEELTSRGIEVIRTTVNTSNDIIMAGEYLNTRNVDAFVVTADNTVYLGLNALARIAEKAQKPLFVTDPMQTSKGAAMGFGVDYRKWGEMSGLLVVEILKKRPPEKNKIIPIEAYNLIVNKKASEAQHWLIPQELLDRADHVIE